MNKIYFNQTGGFPLTTNTLSNVQKAYNIFNQFGFLAGDKTIISGCEKVGNRVNDGYVFVNGELFFLKGGIEISTIRLIENHSLIVFEDGEYKAVHFERYYEFGTGTDSLQWSDFRKYYTNQPIYKEIKYISRSVINSELPTGWYIANGQNGTDNLLGKTIFGYDPSDSDFTTVGSTGGEKSKQISIANLPRVTLSGITSQNGNHRHVTGAKDSNAGNATDHVKEEFVADYGAFSQNNGVYTSYEGVHSHSISLTLNGGEEKLVILPPHIIAIPIQFIG